MSTIKYFLFAYILLGPLSIFSQVDSGYVDVKNGKIFYRVWGSGEPMVFLNGGPGFSSKGYESYAQEMSKIRKVILFDQRGNGRSTLKKVDQYSIQISKMVSDIEAVREHLQIEKWDVYGHSFGGIYAMYYAEKYSSKINKLILSATPSHRKSRIQYQDFKNMSLDDLNDFLEHENFKKLKEEILEGNPSDEVLLKVRLCRRAQNYVYKKENIIIAADWFLNKAEISDNIKALAFRSCAHRKIIKRKLEKITNQVLIIHGISDFINIGNPLENHELFLNSELEIIENSGHIMALDQKEKYFGLIFNFLTKDED